MEKLVHCSPFNKITQARQIDVLKNSQISKIEKIINIGLMPSFVDQSAALLYDHH